MSGWYDWPEYGGYRSNEYGRTVNEKDPQVVLYDHKGRPLTRDKRVGFQPPAKREERGK